MFGEKSRFFFQLRNLQSDRKAIFMFLELSTYQIQAWCYAILNISKDYVRNEATYFLNQIFKVIDLSLIHI